MSDATKQIKKKEKSYKKYTVDFNAAVAGNLVSLEAAIKYLTQNIKVNGLKDKLGESVKVSSTDKKDKQKNTILVQADTKIKFSKRYIKYLVKKFLKRENIALYLRVIAQGPSNYVVKLFNRNSE
jgi:large subunit ribosomal protein L22e